MRTAPKIAISLLLSLLLFSGLAVAAYAGLFNILETRFYQPAVIRSMEEQLGATAKAMDVWHTQNTEKFSQFVGAEAVKRSLLPNQSAQDIFDRSNLAGTLMSDMPGLTGIRIIDAGDVTILSADDKGTRRIHFSTFPSDILKKEELQIAYENYGVRTDDIPFKLLSRADGSAAKVLVETEKDLFLYCFPFYDAYATWRGTAIFYVSARSASQYLVKENLSRISDDLVLLGNPEYTVSGTVTGMPHAGQQLLAEAILERWTNKDFTTDRLVSTDNSGWVLLSREESLYGFTGQLVQENVFTFPQSVKILFLAVTFLTLFLVIFLLFNLKQDEMMIIRNRIRRFHVQLLNEIIDQNEEVRWEEIRKNLSTRKHDISSEIKKSFGRHLNKKHSEEIDSLLNKSWDEILSALGQQETKQAELTNTDEIRMMLEQVLKNNANNFNQNVKHPAQKPHKAPQAALPESVAEEVEDLEDLEELDELTEETDSSIEEVEELDEIEELDELTEETDSSVKEVKELDEIEELDELTEETDSSAEEVEELDEIEELDELTEVPDSSAEEVEEISEIDEFDEDKNFAQSPRQTPVVSIPEEPIEEDAEFIDEQWEPSLLEDANEAEVLQFVEEKKPDTVLVFNFEETTGRTSRTQDTIAALEQDLKDSFMIAGLDFTALDTTETEEATEVSYIDSFLFSRETKETKQYEDFPVYEFLEVIGEEDPDELMDVDESTFNQDSAIMNSDGLFLVAGSSSPTTNGVIDSEFQKLVDSVLH